MIRGLRSGAVLLVALVAGLVVAPAADAVPGYAVTGASAGLNARSGAGTNFPVVGRLANGQPIDIACQVKGTLVGAGLPGTPTDVWDQLSNGWYITDYYTTTPGLGGAFTPGIPQCGGPPAPTTPSPPTPQPGNGVDCSKILFIGLRGSSEPAVDESGLELNKGMGKEIELAFDQLASAGVRMDRLEATRQVRYRAQDVTLGALLTPGSNGYAGSISSGTQIALQALRELRTNASACGFERTRTIIMGYSQGALAAADAIEQMTPQERSTIVGVAFYGDPRYTPGVNGAAGPSQTGRGIAGSRGALPDNVGVRARSYCLVNDPVCASDLSTAVGRARATILIAECTNPRTQSNCAHLRYARLTSAAASFLSGQVR